MERGGLTARSCRAGAGNRALVGRRGWTGPVASQIILDYQGFSARVGQWLLHPGCNPGQICFCTSAFPITYQRTCLGEPGRAGFDSRGFCNMSVFPCRGCAGDAVRDRGRSPLEGAAASCLAQPVPSSTTCTEQLGSKPVVPGFHTF